MKIRSFRIENLKSFRSAAHVEFGPGVNLLIGPNGGGKSNFLDALTIVLRRYFLVGYHLQESSDQTGTFFQIGVVEPFGNIQQMLEPFSGVGGVPAIDIELELEERDIENLQTIVANLESLTNAISRYRNASSHNLNTFQRWRLDTLTPGQAVTYRIRNYNLQDAPGDGQSPSSVVYQYLRSFELLVMLSREMTDFKLYPSFLYFSPFRGGGGPQNFQVSLAGTIPSQQLTGLFSATSRGHTSFLSVAAIYFADKRRWLEQNARADGYDKVWEADEEVKLVTEYLGRLGYTWNLRVVDHRSNRYTLELTKSGVTVDISKLSSGEQEILNYILGIFALNLKHGCLVVDEPELHLHPNWQNVLLELFYELAETTGNQIIAATHASGFITPRSIANVIRVYKDDQSGSNIVRLPPSSIPAVRPTLHMINSHNNETLFFADIVVLVEGIKDRLLVSAFLRWYMAKSNDLRVVRVLEVHGKSHFKDYSGLLQGLRARHYIIADLDYASDVGPPEVRRLFATDSRAVSKNVLNNKKSGDRTSLFSSIEDAVQTKDLGKLEEIWEYIKRRHLEAAELSAEDEAVLDGFRAAEAKKGLFILGGGEIEDYLPDHAGIDAVIELCEEAAFDQWLRGNWDNLRVGELRRIAVQILGPAAAAIDADMDRHDRNRSLPSAGV